MSRLLQVIIALVGLTLTGVLGWASWKNDQLQTQQAYLMLFSQSVAIARSACDVGMLQVAQDAAAKLDELGGEGKYMDHVSAVQGSTQECAANAPAVAAAPPPPAAPGAPLQEIPAQSAPEPAPSAIPERLAVQSQNLEFRRVQNTQAAQTVGAEQFYAVVASYGVNDRNTFDSSLGAVAHYQQLAARASEIGLTVQVFRTRASQHYAIVLAPEGRTRDAARDLVSTARRLGWAPDAFVQEARDWTPCPNPGSNEGLRACGA